MTNQRKAAFGFLAISCIACTAFSQAPAHPILAIGSVAPDFALPGIDGKVHKLADYKDSPLLMVMFICNHCPTSQLYEGRIAKLVDDYRGKGVAFVAVEPNDPKAILLSELGYTDVTDDMEGMKIRAAYRHFTFPYLYDGETQSTAQAYGAQATPHVFLFDRQRMLRYEGRIDDAQRESLVKKRDARAALDALLTGESRGEPRLDVAGNPVQVAHTPSFGCSTKWKAKIDSQLAELKKIEAEPVNVEMVTANDLKKLRSNPSNKVLLVSFWATWCGPCVTEFPDLETTYRMFRRRDFDFVTVSTNYPDERAGVLKILQEQHASGRNLQFATTDTYGLQAAFDAHWDAGVPFTLAIAPGGRVIYQQQGEVNIFDLRRAILANLENETYVGHPAYWAAK